MIGNFKETKILDSGESRKEVTRPDVNRSIMIDFPGAQITSDTGFLPLREIDDRFRIIAPGSTAINSRIPSDEPTLSRFGLLSLHKVRA